MDIDGFREIVKNTSYTLPATSIYPKADRVLKTTNLLIDPNYPGYYYEFANGLKTGFTDQAGDCLVASAEKDGVTFIAVCLNSKTLNNGLREKFLDCKTLFDFAFDNYTTYYQDLQVKLEEAEQAKLALLSNPSSNSSDSNTKNFDFYRILLKIFVVLIILFVIKKLFFKRKKKKRKKH